LGTTSIFVDDGYAELSLAELRSSLEMSTTTMIIGIPVAELPAIEEPSEERDLSEAGPSTGTASGVAQRGARGSSLVMRHQRGLRAEARPPSRRPNGGGAGGSVLSDGVEVGQRGGGAASTSTSVSTSVSASAPVWVADTRSGPLLDEQGHVRG